MKVYVASKFQNYAAVRDVVRWVENAGHTVTFDWTRTEQFDPETGEPLSYNDESTPEVQRRSAELDMSGVWTADCLLVLAHPGMCGGMVEFGIAIGRGKRVAVVSPERCYTIFYSLPNVTTHDSVPAAFEALGIAEAVSC